MEDQGFSLVVRFGSFPHPPPFPFSKLSLFLFLPVFRPSSLLTGIIRGRESLVLYNPYSLVLLFCAQGWLPPENEETKQQDFQARGCHRANKESMYGIVRSYYKYCIESSSLSVRSGCQSVY
jgi:hypothetical protein